MDAQWLNEPPEWSRDGEVLTLTTAPGSDFWRHTHYGFVRDSGHLLAHRVSGDAVVEVTVTADYAGQYDQAGLMVRVDEQRWMKCGVEFVDGEPRFSTVVTNGYSDWSMLPLEGGDAPLRLRVSRRADTVSVEYAVAGSDLLLHRIAHLPTPETWLAGPMAASPEGPGLSAVFADFQHRRIQRDSS